MLQGITARWDGITAWGSDSLPLSCAWCRVICGGLYLEQANRVLRSLGVSLGVALEVGKTFHFYLTPYKLSGTGSFVCLPLHVTSWAVLRAAQCVIRHLGAGLLTIVNFQCISNIFSTDFRCFLALFINHTGRHWVSGSDSLMETAIW